VNVFLLISPAVFEFIGLDEESTDSLDEIADIRSNNLSRARVGSAIDISNYSMPMKIFTFLFRPLFFDAGNIFGLVVSFENLFYLSLLIPILRWRTLGRIMTMPMNLKAAFFILSSTAFFMSSSLSNLGIIVRQKNMVMFMFVLMTLYLISKAQEKNVVRSLRRRPSGPPTPVYEKAKTA
jgi:hypothetical protein